MVACDRKLLIIFADYLRYSAENILSINSSRVHRHGGGDVCRAAGNHGRHSVGAVSRTGCRRFDHLFWCVCPARTYRVQLFACFVVVDTFYCRVDDAHAQLPRFGNGGLVQFRTQSGPMDQAGPYICSAGGLADCLAESRFIAVGDHQERGIS